MAQRTTPYTLEETRAMMANAYAAAGIDKEEETKKFAALVGGMETYEALMNQRPASIQETFRAVNKAVNNKAQRRKDARK